jgi:hypothetical protein
MKAGDYIKCKKSWYDASTGKGVTNKVRYMVDKVMGNGDFVVVGDSNTRVAFLSYEFDKYFVSLGTSVYDEMDWPMADFASPKFLKCECGNKHNPLGQGHSSWCDLYKREF